MIRRKTHSLLCLLLPLGIHAQSSFSMRATLERVPASGFYAINVSPELSAYVQVDFRDIRVLDGAGAQVPFIIDAVDSVIENPARIVPSVKVGAFEPLRAKVRFFSERWIWITILLVSVILFYFSWRLTREVGRRK